MTAPADLVITGCTVVTVDRQDRVLEDASVVVRNGLIEAVTAGGHQPPARRLLDGRGKVVMPGLVNCHTHSVFTLSRGLEPELALGPWLDHVFAVSVEIGAAEAAAGAALGYLEMLESGITTCVDHHYAQADQDNAIAVAEAANAAGLRVCLAPTPVADYERQLDRLDDVVGRNLGVVELWTALASPIRRESAELCRSVRAIARERQTRLTYHFAESRDWFSLIDDPSRPAAFAELLDGIDLLGPDVLMAHGVWLAPGDLRRLGETRTAVSYNPVSNMYLADGVAALGAMVDAGVRVGLGTDAANCNHRCDPFEVMKVGALLQKVARLDAGVVTARDALRLATIGGAEAIGLADRVGSVEVGKQADLVVLDFARPHLVPCHDVMASLVYAAGPDDVETVVVGGRLVVEGGQVVHHDRRLVMERAAAAAAKVAAASAPARRTLGTAGRGPIDGTNP